MPGTTATTLTLLTLTPRLAALSASSRPLPTPTRTCAPSKSGPTRSMRSTGSATPKLRPASAVSSRRLPAAPPLRAAFWGCNQEARRCNHCKQADRPLLDCAGRWWSGRHGLRDRGVRHAGAIGPARRPATHIPAGCRRSPITPLTPKTPRALHKRPVVASCLLTLRIPPPPTQAMSRCSR